MADRRAGFTLMEMLVAFALLLIGLTTIIGLMSAGTAAHHNASARDRAAQALAAARLSVEEDLFTVDAAGSVSTRPRVVLDNRITVPGFSRPLTVRVLVPGTDQPGWRESETVPGEFIGEVEVSWQERGRVRSLTFPWIAVREIPYMEAVQRAMER